MAQPQHGTKGVPQHLRNAKDRATAYLYSILPPTNDRLDLSRHHQGLAGGGGLEHTNLAGMS